MGDPKLLAMPKLELSKKKNGPESKKLKLYVSAP